MTFEKMPGHHGSHLDLVLWVPEWQSPSKVDAIIVPTVRHPENLETAKRLSTELDCTLVTLHSGKWTSATAASARAEANRPRHIAIDVPDLTALRLPDFETTRMKKGTIFERRKDTSAKRNLALMLAYMLDWQRIAFLDDDIDVPDSRDLENAAGLLDDYNAVGLSIGGFPDNSVVCHAYRAIGGNQDTFIGGGALAVETTRNRAFFPDIYNEDWFYLLDPEKGLQPLAITGTVVQSWYDPFQNPERAAMEEFGDVLAEGIFWLLDQGRTLADADSEHWRGYLAERRGFIEYILRNVDKAPGDSALHARMSKALRASLGRLAEIEPERCEKYLEAWKADREAWERHIAELRYRPSTEDALRTLSKKGHPPLSYAISDPTEQYSRSPSSVLT